MIRKCGIEEFTECLILYKSSYDKCSSIKEIIKNVKDDMIKVIHHNEKKKIMLYMTFMKMPIIVLLDYLMKKCLKILILDQLMILIEN